MAKKCSDLGASQPEPWEKQRFFGDYELLEEIARGGMGVVYKARQKSLNRHVAVKVMLSGQFASDAFIKRFQAEAEAAAALRHPNIVSIHEIGRQAGQYFFSMDYIHGTNLAELVREKPLSTREAAKCLKIIAEAVHHAHENGILHRDLKPSNILIDSTGQPRITDFGLAKRFNSDSDLTLTGQVLGSPNYMPPEQAAGKVSETSPMSDVYSLGAILYHVLTGRPPFLGENPGDVIQQTLQSHPLPPRSLVPSIPAALETICLKCLAKEQSRRYSTASALAQDLGRFLLGEAILARPASPAYKSWLWCRRKPAMAVSLVSTLLLLIAMAAGSNVAAVRISAEASRTTKEAERAIRAERSATEKLWASYLSLARANRFSHQPGQRLLTFDVLAKAAQIQPSLALRNEAIAAMALPDARFVKERKSRYVEFPHDAILFRPDMQVYAEIMPKGMIAIRRVEDDFELFTLSANSSEVDRLNGFSPDGNYLYASYEISKGTVIDLRNGSVRLQRVNGGSFSSDSKSFAAVTADGFIKLFELESGKEIARLSRRVGTANLAFHPAGHLLACRIGQEKAIKILDIPSEEVIADIPCHPDFGCSWSPDGKLLAIPCVDGYGYIWNLETHDLRKTLQAHQRRMTRLAFSNDGSLLASTSWDDTVRLWESASGKQLLSLNGSSYQMVFSPDDRLLAFASQSSGLFGLIELSKHPEFRSFNAFNETHQNDFMALSPDGRWIATGCAQGEGIRLIDFQTGRQFAMLPEKECVSVAFNNDSKSLFAATADSVVQWTLQFPSDAEPPSSVRPVRQLLPLPSGCWDVRVSSNGLYLGVTDQGADKALLLDLKSGKISFELPHHQIKLLAISPDGKWLASAPRNGSSIKVWELATGQVVKKIPASTGHVLFSPDSQWLATSSKSCRIFETGTWRELAQIPGPTKNPNMGAMSFSPDATMLAVQKGPEVIELLKMPGAEPLASFQTPDSSLISSISFSPDGQNLVMLTLAGDVNIWDLGKVREQLRSLGLDWDGPRNLTMLRSLRLGTQDKKSGSR